MWVHLTFTVQFLLRSYSDFRYWKRLNVLLHLPAPVKHFIIYTSAVCKHNTNNSWITIMSLGADIKTLFSLHSCVCQQLHLLLWSIRLWWVRNVTDVQHCHDHFRRANSYCVVKYRWKQNNMLLIKKKTFWAQQGSLWAEIIHLETLWEYNGYTATITVLLQLSYIVNHSLTVNTAYMWLSCGCWQMHP